MNKTLLAEYCADEKSCEEIWDVLREHEAYPESVNHNFLKNLVPLYRLASKFVQSRKMQDQVCVRPLQAEVVSEHGQKLFVEARFALCDRADGQMLLVTHQQFNPLSNPPDCYGPRNKGTKESRILFQSDLSTQLIQDYSLGGAYSFLQASVETTCLRPLEVLTSIDQFLVESRNKPYIPG